MWTYHLNVAHDDQEQNQFLPATCHLPPATCQTLILKTQNNQGDLFLDTLEFAHLMIDTVADKKASDIILLDLRQQSVFTDYFLLCSTSNERQLRAIAESVWDDAKQKADIVGMSIEGTPSSGWMLVDFGDLIVHIFLEEQRSYYDLEGLWSESNIVMRMP